MSSIVASFSVTMVRTVTPDTPASNESITDTVRKLLAGARSSSMFMVMVGCSITPAVVLDSDASYHACLSDVAVILFNPLTDGVHEKLA